MMTRPSARAFTVVTRLSDRYKFELTNYTIELVTVFIAPFYKISLGHQRFNLLQIYLLLALMAVECVLSIRMFLSEDNRSTIDL